jgi:hypothetical protein
MYKKFLFFYLILFVTSCEDSDNHLIGNYYYDTDMASLRIRTKSKKNREIWGTIIDYSYDSNYILVIQNPSYLDYIGMIGETIEYPRNSDKDFEKIQEIASRQIKYDTFYQKIFAHKYNYWIIYPAKDTIYGPLTKEEYHAKREELHIPKQLKLHEEY